MLNIGRLTCLLKTYCTHRSHSRWRKTEIYTSEILMCYKLLWYAFTMMDDSVPQMSTHTSTFVSLCPNQPVSRYKHIDFKCTCVCLIHALAIIGLNYFHVFLCIILCRNYCIFTFIIFACSWCCIHDVQLVYCPRLIYLTFAYSVLAILGLSLWNIGLWDYEHKLSYADLEKWKFNWFTFTIYIMK